MGTEKLEDIETKRNSQMLMSNLLGNYLFTLSELSRGFSGHPKHPPLPPLPRLRNWIGPKAKHWLYQTSLVTTKIKYICLTNTFIY